VNLASVQTIEHVRDPARDLGEAGPRNTAGASGSQDACITDAVPDQGHRPIHKRRDEDLTVLAVWHRPAVGAHRLNEMGHRVDYQAVTIAVLARYVCNFTGAIAVVDAGRKDALDCRPHGR